jgi:hypothetical protein
MLKGLGYWDALRGLSSRPFCSFDGPPGRPLVFTRTLEGHDPTSYMATATACSLECDSSCVNLSHY